LLEHSTLRMTSAKGGRTSYNERLDYGSDKSTSIVNGGEGAVMSSEPPKISTSISAPDASHNALVYESNALPADLVADDVRTTLVTQTSFNRIWLLDETCKRWRANHCRGRSFGRENHNEFIAGGAVTLIQHIREDAPELYPEPLAKFGLDAVETSHVWSSTWTLPSASRRQSERRWKSVSSFEKIGKLLGRKKRKRWSSRRLNEITAQVHSRRGLQRHVREDGAFIPHTFSWKENFAANKVSVFNSVTNCLAIIRRDRKRGWRTKWYETRTETRTILLQRRVRRWWWWWCERWILPFRPTPRSCPNCAMYWRWNTEPYVVLRWCPAGQSAPEDAPYYDERFHGYRRARFSMWHFCCVSSDISLLFWGVHRPLSPSPIQCQD
jgi:hypothetical protein